MTFKIDFLCNDGSPLGVTMKSLWGDDGRTGVGGSELAMLTMCELWTDRGYQVRLYNNPYEQNASKFEQLPVNAFNKDDDRDVLIVFRSPNYNVFQANGMKVWWSCDQYTLHDRPFKYFAPHVDKIVGISQYHKQYFKDTYGIDRMTVIDIPVRMDDFLLDYEERVPNRLIYTSVPDRGLMNLHAVYPELKQAIPDLSLVITSDYRLWGLNHPNNQKYLSAWIGEPDVMFRGALNRRDYLKELHKADIFAYPHKAVNGELFCVSCAEAQYAGAYPVTSDFGALSTTNMGFKIKGDAENIGWRREFIKVIVALLDNRDVLDDMRDDVLKAVSYRFSPENILEQWDRVFEL